jgi:DNA-directed RNA polymerase subunit omega
MLYPSIDELLNKVNSKYKLVALASKRARELRDRNNCFVEKPVSHKHVGMSLEEIVAGHVTIAAETELKQTEE